MANELRLVKITLLICCFTMLYFGILDTQTIVTKNKHKEKTLTPQDLRTTKNGHMHDSPTTRGPRSKDRIGSSPLIKEPKPMDTIGSSSFKHYIQTSEKPYVDKTRLILEILTGSQVIAIFRPRQCGKTFNLDMLREFLRIDGDSKNLFRSNFTVMQKMYKYVRDDFMNKFPVLFISLADLDICQTYNKAKQNIKKAILNGFVQYKYIRANLEEYDKKKFDYYYESKVWEQLDFEQVLRDFCRFLLQYFGKPPFLIVDEIDAPIVGATTFGYEEDMASLTRLMYLKSFKTNRYIHQVILAGVVPIPLYLPSSVLIYDITKSAYDSYFGLTAADVHNLILEYGGDEHPYLLQNLTAWYNQFQVGRERIYNPQSVIECVSNNWKIEQYRTVSGSLTNLTQRLLIKQGALPALNVQALLTNVTLKKRIARNVDFPNLFECEPNLWCFLIYSGLISVRMPIVELQSARKNALLKIPGEETKLLLEEIIASIVHTNQIPDYIKFTELVNEWNEKEVFKFMKKYVENAGSYLYGEGKKASPEDVVEYVKLMMAHWTDLYGKNITVGEERKNELPFSFYDADGDLKMALSVNIRSGLWENVKTSFMNPFREKLIASLPDMSIKLLKAYAKKKKKNIKAATGL